MGFRDPSGHHAQGGSDVDSVEGPSLVQATNRPVIGPWKPNRRVYIQGGALTRFGARPESLLGIARAATDTLLASTDATPDLLLLSNFDAGQIGRAHV